MLSIICYMLNAIYSISSGSGVYINNISRIVQQNVIAEDECYCLKL